MNNNSANFIRIKLNFDGIENLIKKYAKFNDGQKCDVSLECIDRTGETYLNIQWNKVKNYDFMKGFHQYMNIFYNAQTKNYYFDTLNVSFKENVDPEDFKQSVKDEIDSILSKYAKEDEERNI